LEGSIKYWLPECADWAACPACYSVPNTEIPRDEGLLFTILATTAALAAHVLVGLITGLEANRTKTHNYLSVEMGQLQIEKLAVLKRKHCPLCSFFGGRAWRELDLEAESIAERADSADVLPRERSPPLLPAVGAYSATPAW
jgi:hypothetical protein